MTKPEQIQTREHLIAVIEEMIIVKMDAYGHIEDETGKLAIEIVDLIADLPNMCYHDLSHQYDDPDEDNERKDHEYDYKYKNEV